MEKEIKRSLIGFFTTKKQAEEIKQYAESVNLSIAEMLRQSIELHKQLNK
jgi:hypothetical protein